MGFQVILKSELLSIWREPRFWIPFLIPPTLIIISQYFAPSKGLIHQGLYLLLGVLFSTMSVSLTADSFAGERERKTLETLLSAPISPKALFWGKFLSVVTIPILFITLGQAVFLIQSKLKLGEAFIGWIHSIGATAFISGFTLWLSMKFETVRSAAQTSLIVILPLYFFVQLMAYKIFYSSFFLAMTLLVYFSGAIIFFILAQREFNRIKL